MVNCQNGVIGGRVTSFNDEILRWLSKPKNLNYNECTFKVFPTLVTHTVRCFVVYHYPVFV